MKNIYCDFGPRHSGKTSRLTKIAEEHGGFYLFSYGSYTTKVTGRRHSNRVTWLNLSNNIMTSDYMHGRYIGNVYIDKGPKQKDLPMELFFEILSNPRVDDIYLAADSLQSFNPEIQKYIKEHYPEYAI